MVIHLIFLGSLQYDIGQMQISIPLEEGSTVKSVVKTFLKNQKFKALKSFFTDSFESNRSILIFINDQDITVLSGMSSLLQEGDKLTFIPVIHGG
jgi:molybdopterin converting factor small subunit